MKTAERYILLHEFGLTTRFLARKYDKDPRTIRRLITNEIKRASWAEECRRYIARKIDGVTYQEFWSDEDQ
jgi:hypothetical protein